jgi:lysophospholipase L1-like esterase
VIPCLVLGDSIAVGVGHQLPECRTEAHVGISSTQLLREPDLTTHADKVVISLGANDGNSPQTLSNLIDLRQSVQAKVVYWLMPAITPAARQAVRQVANRFGDRIIDTAPFVGPDRLHPTGQGYRQLASLTR